MTAICLFFLVCVVALSWRLGRTRLARGALVAALLWFLIVGCGPLGYFLLNSLQIYDSLRAPNWQKRNIIVVLGAGTVRWPQQDLVHTFTLGESRLVEGARLYSSCKAVARECRMLLSGGDPLHNGVSEAETMGQELKAIGVDEKDLIFEKESRNTFENARFSSELLKAADVKYIVLVTSGLHLRRSLRYFSHFAIHAVPAPSDFMAIPWSPLPMAINFVLADAGLHEFLDLLRFHIQNSIL